jgi:hypothetical protein
MVEQAQAQEPQFPRQLFVRQKRGVTGGPAIHLADKELDELMEGMPLGLPTKVATYRLMETRTALAQAEFVSAPAV